MLMRIGGADVAAADESWIRVTNPATGEEIDRVPAGSGDDVARAVEAAGAAGTTGTSGPCRRFCTGASTIDLEPQVVDQEIAARPGGLLKAKSRRSTARCEGLNTWQSKMVSCNR